VCSSSKKANDPAVEAANNRAHRAATHAEVVEIIEEDCTEPGLKSYEESATCEDENLNGECSHKLDLYEQVMPYMKSSMDKVTR
jgi:hypothetical protein